MRTIHVLVVVALGQGALLAGLMVLIILTRWLRQRRGDRLAPARAAVDGAMRAWVVGQTDADPVRRALAALPAGAAVDALVSWSARVPGERWRDLAQLLAAAPWARSLRRDAASRRWWRRLDAARFLSVAATPTDLPGILLLLRDEHPAVHLAAVAAVERLPRPALLAAALDRLPRLTPTVVAYYAGLLQRARTALVPLLAARLTPHQPALAHYAEFAARLGDPALRPTLAALAEHPDVEVRVQAARGLGGYPHPDSFTQLAALARDSAWQVRAQAIRSLGRLADPRALPLLAAALADREWWVRLRAALALTRLEAAGRQALVKAETGPSAGAREMARLVLGLAPQALAEFAA